MGDGGVGLVPLQPQEEGDTVALMAVTRILPTASPTCSGCYENRWYLNQLFPPASPGLTRQSQSHPPEPLRRKPALAEG